MAGPGISAVLLFGSRARGDSSRGSDTDLLLISPPGAPRHKSSGHLSMFFYPWAKLVADARKGDLFVCHLTLEAKPVFDPAGRLDELRSAFRMRPNYRREIAQALDVGTMIDRFAERLDPEAAARRMVWCVRTVLIARSAERGEPIFAPARLATTASPAAADILISRHQRKPDATMRFRFRRFLTEEGVGTDVGRLATLEDYEALFKRTGNAVGSRTIHAGRDACGTYS